MTKEEIIKLAKEKEFVSKELYNNPYKYSTHEDMRWLFWLTEIQKWLRDKHGIDIDIIRNNNEFVNFVKEKQNVDVPKYLALILINGDNCINYRYYNNTYEQALEAGIIEALKLI